ncbi:MAG: TonB-dependent receptor [Hyphomicrobiaceae bacterium]
MLAGTGITWRYVGANAVTISVPGEGDASGASATVEGAIALDTIDVSGGGAQAAADLPYQTPGSSAYVSAEQIQRIPPATAGDIFKSTSGVISAGNRNGAAMDVNIRGMQGMNRVAVLVDGTQQSDSSARGYGGHNSRTFVDPDLIGGIDIEKGPSTGPLGAGAAGGVVNMRTIDAHDLVKEGNSVGVRLKAGIGTNSIEPPPINSLTPRGADENDQAFTSGNHTRSIALGVLTKHFEFTVAQSHRQNGNYFSGANGTNGKSAKMPNGYSPYLPGGEVYNTSQRSDSFLLKSKLKLNEHSLELGYIRMKNKYGEEYPDYSNSQSIFTYLVQWDLNDVNTQTYTAKYRWNPVDTELIDFKVNVWGTDLHAVYPSYFLNRTTQVYTKGMEAWNNSVFDSPIGAVELMYGGQYNFEETAARLTTTGGKSADNINGERTIAGLFSRAQIKFTDWLTARVGLRYDTYSTVGVAPSVTPEQKDSRVNPSASITLEPIKGLQFFGSYVEGWRPPSVREAVFLQPLGSTKQIVNPNLRPELAKNYEVGMNVLMKSALVDDDSLRFKASYFDNNYEGYIVRMGGQYAGLPPGSPFVFGNIDAAYFNGVEVSLSYDSKRFFADASYTYYTDVEYCVRPTGCAPKEAPNDYSALYVPPKYHGSVTLGTKWLDGALKAGARVHFAGERAIGRTDWAPYRILDVFSSYHVSENLTIDASAENILDRYYVDALLEAHLPSPGRTIRTRATLRF